MDLISQGLWGALCSEAAGLKVFSKVERKDWPIPPWLIGLLAGLAPDLDVLISSSSDPLFATVMHRHFTHSILFIPIGALLIWLLFFYWFKSHKTLWLSTYLICFFGYGTHWILDTLTAYGTQIFWPITNHRFALDWLSIVDPLLTLPWLVILLLIIFKKGKVEKLIVRCFSYTLIYFIFCGWQHEKALSSIYKIAASRNHIVSEARALPSLANSFWFRGIYLSEGQIYSDGYLAHPLKGNLYKAGESRPHLKPEDLISDNETVKKQVHTWNWFTGDWMYFDDKENMIIGDARYSLSVEGFTPLWAFQLNLQNPSLSFKLQPDMRKSAVDRSPFEGFKLLLDSKELVLIP